MSCCLARRAPGWLLLLCLTACNLACNLGYGEPFERPSFGTSALHEDGARCIFALHDVVYRPAEGLRAFPDGGVPRYVVDRHKLGSVDVRSGDVTLLVDQKNRDWLPGHGGFHVVGAAGGFALVRQAGQRNDYEQHHVWWRLDLTSGELQRLDLDAELARQGRALGRVELADRDFNLILLTHKGERPQEIWSRNASAGLRQLATTDHYYGVSGGEIWWYDVAARAGARTRYDSGATRHERRADFAMPREDPTLTCRASFDGRELILQEKLAGSWRDRPLPVDAPALR